MKLLSDKYIIIEKIGSGSFGNVYVAQDRDTGAHVAVKVEDNKKIPRIINEHKIYRYLTHKGFTEGLPKIHVMLYTKNFNIMVMQLLGKNLEELLNDSDRKFSLSTVFMIAEQLITLLSKLHNTGFIHRDIKPNNFLIDKDMGDMIYMMDFGLSKRYINKGQHIKFNDRKSLVGTARYASINMHMGIEPTRRDDLESVGYMLVYFLKGRLPWQGLMRKKGMSSLDQIGEVKICTSLNDLCSDLPKCFMDYIDYCRKLKFNETPDYEYIKKLFSNEAKKLNIKPYLEWIDKLKVLINS